MSLTLNGVVLSPKSRPDFTSPARANPATTNSAVTGVMKRFMRGLQNDVSIAPQPESEGCLRGCVAHAGRLHLGRAITNSYRLGPYSLFIFQDANRDGHPDPSALAVFVHKHAVDSAAGY